MSRSRHMVTKQKRKGPKRRTRNRRIPWRRMQYIRSQHKSNDKFQTNNTEELRFIGPRFADPSISRVKRNRVHFTYGRRNAPKCRGNEIILFLPIHRAIWLWCVRAPAQIYRQHVTDTFGGPATGQMKADRRQDGWQHLLHQHFSLQFIWIFICPSPCARCHIHSNANSNPPAFYYVHLAGFSIRKEREK